MSRLRRQLSKKFWQYMLFLGLVEIPPPVLINRDEIDITHLVHIDSMIDELIGCYDATEEDGDFCGCYLNGMGEAISIVQYLAEEQLVLNTAVLNMHSDLDAFSRGELEL